MSLNEATEWNSSAIPIRIEKEISELLPKFDETALCGKNANGQQLQRQDLYLLAMAIGCHQDKRTPLKNPIGLIRAVYLTPDTVSIRQAVHIHILRQNAQEDKIDDINEAYQIANEYANTGFHYLKDIVTNPNFDEEDAQLDLRAACRTMSQA